MLWNWLRRTITKSDCFQEIADPKKYFFWKIGCSEEVPISKKYMFWIITYPEEKVPPGE